MNEINVNVNVNVNREPALTYCFVTNEFNTNRIGNKTTFHTFFENSNTKTKSLYLPLVSVYEYFVLYNFKSKQ